MQISIVDNEHMAEGVGFGEFLLVFRAKIAISTV